MYLAVHGTTEIASARETENTRRNVLFLLYSALAPEETTMKVLIAAARDWMCTRRLSKVF
jgi:hypothetical protein